MTTAANYGDLCDYTTGDYIRPATQAEAKASLQAGPEGVISIGGKSCFVCGISDNDLLKQYPDSVSAVFNEFIHG